MRKTTVFVCPFALFGNPGAQRGAELLGDAVREMLDDAQAEQRPTRSHAFVDNVRSKELPLATLADVANWRKKAREVARVALDAGELLIWLGGNHLSVAPLYEELGGRDGSLVVQFDAHLDVYHYHDVTTEPTHGNFLRHLEGPSPTIVNVGHRDLFLPDEEVKKFFADALGIGEVGEADKRLKSHVRKAKRVCLDIDWDVLDPAFFPAVGDALPFGMLPVQLLTMLRSSWSDKVAAVSFSEFDPSRDDGDRSLQLAAWLIEQILLWVSVEA